jgi:large subunit ribosomal protein L21
VDTQNAYAIIATGGKQYRIKVGQRCKFEKLAGEPGDTIELGNVLMVANGDNVQVGAPYLDKGKVIAKILGQGRGKKVTIIKMRRRKTYRRKQGHRQSFTEVEIVSLPAA